jgi:class 3 adenylate cyclase/tetratricopeptide (TPR) repeat protein
MSNPAVLETIASYLPALIVRRLAASSDPIPLPTCEEHPAAVLFADISGFTALTERLATQGVTGAEILTQLLNTYFGQLINIVTAHGGDVVKFAGDALLALWQDESGNDDLTVLALRAAQCAIGVQDTLLGYETPEGVRLALRVAVGAGPVRHLHLGGVFGRCEFLAVGEPFADVGAANKQVRPEDAVVTPRAWQLIGERCEGETLPSGDVRLLKVREPLSLRALDRLTLTLEAEPVVRNYIPAAVRSRLEAGQTAWVGELRQLTVLFVNLPDLSFRTDPIVAQLAMCELQHALYRYEGSINKLSVDDKGVTLVAALGLPPLAHENDALRGVQAAMNMHERMRSLGWSSSIGVTTGRAFCGAYGSSVRREYTMIGKVVNLSARLMQAAADGILCDDATHRAANGRIEFEVLSPIHVKGRTEPVPVFRPLRESHNTVLLSGKPLIDRESERQALSARLKALCNHSEGSVVVLEGEAGIGKSRLLWELLQRARAEKVAVLSGGGDAIDRSTPYFAWRPVFRQMFHLEGAALTQEGWRQETIRQLGDDAELLRLAPLLSAVLPGDWPANEITAEMTGEIRADNTNRLLLRLLTRAATRPLLLALDDAQWLDSASWTLARLTARDISSILLVLSTRPVGSSTVPGSVRGLPRVTQEAPAADPLPVEHHQLLYAPTTFWVRLDALPRTETSAIVCQRLGVRSLPAPIAELIYEKGQGNPYFSEQLAYALRDTHLLEIEGEECRLSPTADMRSITLPDTVQGVVTSRIDRLRPAEQLTLKVASVIGRVFSLRILTDIYPIEADRESLPDHLLTLKRLDLTRLERPEPNLAYSFKHSITLEVVYNLMLVSQRRDLHRAVAEWYELNHAHDLIPLSALLAHHWREAKVDVKAIDYMEKAGEQALSNHANDEAVNFFADALALDEKAGLQNGAYRRAHWTRQLAEAHYAQGNLAPAQKYLEESVALLGFPVPASGFRRVTGSMTQLFRQMLHRIMPAFFVGRGGARRDALLLAARSYEGLATVHYQNNSRVHCLHAALRSLNLAEAAGVSPELARSYANASVVYGLMGFHRIAQAHAHRARETARQVNQLACSTYVLEVTGIYWYSVGRWDAARDALGMAAELAESLGDVRRWDETLVPFAMLPFHHGDFRASASIPVKLLASAKRRGILQVQCWALSWRLASLLPQGLGSPDIAAQVSESILALEALLTKNIESADKLVRADQVLGYGVLAQARWRRGEIHLALQAADRGAMVSANCVPISHYTLEGYVGMLEVYTGLWEAGKGQNAAVNQEIPHRCWPLCKTLWKFARMHPVGYPQAWLWYGRCLWLSGKTSRARRAFRKALAAAERLRMPYDGALAQYEAGRHATGSEREMHLTQAREVFARLGAVHDLARVDAERKKEPQG